MIACVGFTTLSYPNWDFPAIHVDTPITGSRNKNSTMAIPD